MPILREQITTPMPIDEAFAFVADFANSMLWDPGVAESRRLDDAPLGLGSRFRLGVRMRGRVAPMDYTITTFEPPRQVVLTGSGSGVSAIDDIRFEATASGTRIDYVADIRLTGLLRLIEPFARGTFDKIGREALAGMRAALDQRAGAAADVSHGRPSSAGAPDPGAPGAGAPDPRAPHAAVVR
jgi:carbon monoxide dehydrogenase subunit G